MRRYNYLTTLVLSVILGLLVMELPLWAPPPEYATPDTYLITLYKTELSSNNGTSWVTVFTSATGAALDFKTNAGNAFGPGTTIPPGTYNAIRFTIKNTISASGTNYTPNDSLSVDAQIPVYFAVSGTFGWDNNGSSLAEAFPLPDPIRVVANATSKLIINFGINDALKSIDGTNWELLPPTLTVSNIVVPTSGILANFPGGEYYYVRQNLRLPANTAQTITPTQLSIESGWGTISLGPLTNGVGTLLIAADSDKRNSRWIGDDGLDIGGQIVTDTGGTAMTGKYYMDADGYINMLLSGTDGIIRGALRNDGKVFVAIEISSPSSETVNTDVSYHMIYAILKEDNSLDNLDGNYVWNNYMLEVRTARSEDTGDPILDNYALEAHVDVGWITGTAVSLTGAGTNNRIEIHRPLSPDAQTVIPPAIQYDGPWNNATPLVISTTGTFAIDEYDEPSGSYGFVLGDGSVGLMAGIVNIGTDVQLGITNTNYAMLFGVALKAVPIGTHTTASVAGSYSFVYKGDHWDSASGHELPSQSVMLGRIILDGSGNVSGRAIRCEQGQTIIEDLSGFHYDVSVEQVGAVSPTGILGTDFIEVDIIRLYETDPLIPAVKMLIGSDGKTLAPYSPIWTDAGRTIINNERGLGLAVKQD